MELFHEDGHLTDQGLQAIVDESLDEMGRLEAAEHLGFCDSCLVRYTALLSGEVLLTPETPVREGVMARLRQRARRIMWSKYGTVAAAAVLAVAMWTAGSLAVPHLRDNLAEREPPAAQSQQAAPVQDTPAQAEQIAAPQPGIAARLDSALSSATTGINDFFGGLIPGNSGALQAAKEAEKQQRDKHLSLFEDKNKAGQDDKQDDAGKTDDNKTPDSAGTGEG